MIQQYLLGCDWGTSSFRLRLIQISNQAVLGEVVSDEGISSTFHAWKIKGEQHGIDRQLFFRDLLQKHIHLLADRLSFALDGVTIMISGMASSSIGMEETLYAELPFAVDGSQTKYRYFPAHESFPHPIVLISGVKAAQDVMRGEETELMGMVSLLNLQGRQMDRAVFIFPGTHSKHLYVEEGQLINFQTFMTGEVFGLMARQSILKNSVDIQEMAEHTKAYGTNFRAGVQAAEKLPILRSLFTVRINQLFNRLDKKQNAFYLSGLLIGSELRSLLTTEPGEIMLCGDNQLARLYQLALDELDLLDRMMVIPPELTDKAALAGQVKLFQRLKNYRYES